MTEHVDCVVVGAGVVGLAIARALALTGREVLVLEAAEAFGTQTSSRNSEVIHAGVYYAPGSLKARLCVAGRQALYAYCAAMGIPHVRCEKLIVATPEGGAPEIERLKTVQARAAAAGVSLHWLDAAQAQALEPALRCSAALHSPETGIVDTHTLMLSLLGEAEAHGATLVTHAPVRGGRASAEGVILDVGGADPLSLQARLVINAAGHGAQTLTRALVGASPAAIPPQHYCKGNYFSLSGKPPFSRLIYPTPGEDSLGLHYTRDMGGTWTFWPRCRMDLPPRPRRLRLHGERGAGPALYRGYSTVLARPYPRSPASRLCRGAPQDSGRGGTGPRLCFARPGPNRRGRLPRPLWDRIAGPDLLPCPC
ncbi:FAD dependent oxidoreductase [Pararhodospirillum photometricum DSM 122]|uniref:FAD dependent oxidoreductase n=1 Tax=Pararhodospirillum photometricum DSM 122 TaxID=1150469 RepID=H6SQ99_PARPM|nr:FAD dependent oxidoreductase [Pararhodospirillum photometricum DSM 122]